MVIWLDPDVVQCMDSWLHTDNCKNRSEMIGKALVYTLLPYPRTLAATSGWIDAEKKEGITDERISLQIL